MKKWIEVLQQERGVADLGRGKMESRAAVKNLPDNELDPQRACPRAYTGGQMERFLEVEAKLLTMWSG